MLLLGPLGFTAPWLLLGLLALPVLYWLLRAVPPAPIRRRFPGVALLLGLRDETAEADKTPWWLLALRMLALAAAILAFAGPVMNPQAQVAGREGPLLILIDGTWADARDWPRRLDRISAVVEQAGREGRRVALARLSDAPSPVQFQAPDAIATRLTGLKPEPFTPKDLALWQTALPDESFDSYWLSDGLDHPGRAALTQSLRAKGELTVFETPRPVLALHPARFTQGVVTLAASRLPFAQSLEVNLLAFGPDPAGIERELARLPLRFEAGRARAEAQLNLPPELRNRLTRFEVEGIRSAAAVSLTDDSLKRRKVALLGASDDREGLQLLQPSHYLRQALQPVADLMEGNLTDMLRAAPDAVILADVARLSQVENDALLDWLEGGGVLLRFAGSHLAASDVSRMSEDPLLPVRLREGGRTVGGAMSWGEPKALAPFTENSPFYGLAIPADVEVRAQVLAQPDPDLAARTIAALTDGTPLVTRKAVGQGQVVLFHVTANAEWSNLPLSGLFMQMLERLAVSTRAALDPVADLTGQVFVPEVMLDAYGTRLDAGERGGVAGADLAQALLQGPNPALPPGLYAGAERRVALNVIAQDTPLRPAVWPIGTKIEGLEVEAATSLKGPLLTLGLVLLMADLLASLWVSGRMRGGASALVLGLALLLPPPPAQAQTADAFALEATHGVVLAHVLTGEASVDDTANQGLAGLGDVLWARTSIEPEMPMGVDIEADELSFFPFLYWPISTQQPLPSAAAYAKLNDYLRTGGMILFDTRDGDVAGGSAESQYLERLAAGLDIPALEPLPSDHVLTRTFYLLQDFPGRQAQGTVWVEAAPADAEQVEGMPFRNLNDGVTPVIIGSNDWASAWAVTETGAPLLPVGRGYAGERQRELAYRFGVNVIMHVLTGNYKSDQVHVPALLDRLGQ